MDSITTCRSVSEYNVSTCAIHSIICACNLNHTIECDKQRIVSVLCIGISRYCKCKCGAVTCICLGEILIRCNCASAACNNVTINMDATIYFYPVDGVSNIRSSANTNARDTRIISNIDLPSICDTKLVPCLT